MQSKIRKQLFYKLNRLENNCKYKLNRLENAQTLNSIILNIPHNRGLIIKKNNNNKKNFYN